MKINVLTPLKDYSGKNLTTKETNMVDGKPVTTDKEFTIRDAFENAINSLKTDPTTKQPELLTTEVRNKIYQINLKLYALNSSHEADLSVTELAFIKDRADIGYANNPLVYGRICEVIEGPQTEEVKLPKPAPAAAEAQTPPAPAAAPEKGAN